MSALAAALGPLYDRHGEKVRFLVVGGANTLFSVVLFNSLIFLAGPWLRSLASSPAPLAALAGREWYNVIFWGGWVAAVPVSTTTMKLFAFRSPGPLGRQILRAYWIYVPAQAIGSGLMWLLVGRMGLPPSLAQLLTIAVTTVFSYFGHKHVTFGGGQLETAPAATSAGPPDEVKAGADGPGGEPRG